MSDSDRSASMPVSKKVALALAALVAGAGSVWLIETTGILNELPSEFVEMPMSPSKEYMARYRVAFRELLTHNYAIHFGTFGALLGLAIGMAGDSKNRTSSIGFAVLGGFACGGISATLGGFLLGWITSLGLEVNWETLRFIGFQIDPLVQSTVLQCTIWSTIGIAIGIGCTLASSSTARIAKAARGGLLGGVLAGILYSISGAIFFSSSSAFDFVPVNFSERIIWSLICSVSICAGLLLSLSNRRPGQSNPFSVESEVDSEAKAGHGK